MNIDESWKPMGDVISKQEREVLKSCNFRWCPKCKNARPQNLFRVSKAGNIQPYCNPCQYNFNKEYFKENPELIRKYGHSNYWRNHEVYAQRRKERAPIQRIKEREYRKKNREHFREYRRKYEAHRRANDPSYRAYCRLLACVRRFNMIGKNGRSLQYIGVSSADEFIQLMIDKSGNPSWLEDGWHIDHIWQIGWFEISEENWKDICPIVNNHTNLRPLSPSDNLTREHDDFSSLKEVDFEKYLPHLKPKFAEKIRMYFESTCKQV